MGYRKLNFHIAQLLRHTLFAKRGNLTFKNNFVIFKS